MTGMYAELRRHGGSCMNVALTYLHEFLHNCGIIYLTILKVFATLERYCASGFNKPAGKCFLAELS